MENRGCAEAVLLENGKILAVGKNTEFETTPCEKTDLGGKTVLPSFIDAHSHLSGCAAAFLQVDLSKAQSFDDIAQAIKRFKTENGLQGGAWIIAAGYDHNQLREHAHPQKQQLDALFPDNPVLLQHRSGHFGVMNSAALHQTAAAESNTGVLGEGVYLAALKKVPMPDTKSYCAAFQKAQQKYAAYGITTVQEGMLVRELLPVYQELVSTHQLFLDVVAYTAPADAAVICKAFPAPRGHFRVGGYKIFLDGSPQCKTAWMTAPYRDGHTYGEQIMKDSEVEAALSAAVKNGVQLLAHCNGDAACKQFIRAVEKTKKNGDTAALRPVMIHAQFLHRNQLRAVKRLGIIPSFFVAHVLYWGDVHIANLGLERAQYLSPARSALQEGILFTLHQDAPVIEPDMLETVSCAVNRKTASGTILGKSESLPVYEALKAITYNAAYQYGELHYKGSIKAGKSADFVVLEENPLTVKPEQISQIQVLQTVKNGKSVFKAY